MTERQSESNASQKKAARQTFISLRAKLTLAHLVIMLLALLGSAYYLLARTQALRALWTEQLDKSVEQEVTNRLDILLSNGVSRLDTLFSLTEQNLNTARLAAEAFLLQEDEMGEGIYISGALWDANEALFPLPTGSLDNPNDEVGSIFLPAHVPLTEDMRREINVLKQLDTIAPVILKNSNFIALYFGGTGKEALYYPNIDLANILPPDFDVTQRPWFVNATPEANPGRNIVWSLPIQDAALHGLVIPASMPIYDSTNTFRGVLGADVLMSSVTQAVNAIRVGETGYAFLIDREGRVVIMPKEGYADFGIPANITDEELVQYTLPDTVSIEMFKVIVKMVHAQQGLQKIEVNGVEKYFAYRPISNVRYSLGIVVPTSELRKPLLLTLEHLKGETARTITLIFVMWGLMLGASVVVSWLAGNALTNPLANLTQTASEIASGNLTARATIKALLGKDETTILAETLNWMSEKVQELVTTLEERVQERTAVLQRRAGQLQAVSEVVRAAASIRQLDVLLHEVTHQISEQFGFYHVGIFLLDASGQNAVLVAANSEGGQKMLARQHKLAVEPRSIVGFVASTRSPRIALDTGADAVFFDNPDLPQTRSEMALPLKVGEQLIGVLDVQSTETNAFSQEDIAVISTLADQVALVIENARSFEKTQQALARAEDAYQKYFGQSWAQFTRQLQITGYACKEGVTLSLDKASTYSPADNEKGLLRLPLTLRGQTLGVLEIRSRQPERAWKHDEIILAQAAAERAALALESAYLLEEARRRAARERAISEVTSKIGESVNLKNILRTAVEELGRAIPGSEVSISLQPKETDR